jgi:hypothetical protein
MKEAGANGLVIAEPAAGLLSPDLCEEFSSKYVKKIVEAVQDDNFAIVYHNCGNTVPLIDSIVGIGANAYHFGNAVDIGVILEKMPSNIPVLGVLISGGQHEGIFALNYRLTGAISSPVITVNPLSALAPGLMRKILGVIDGTAHMPGVQ